MPTAREPRPLSLLVYGPTKAGKSLVAASTEPPRLYLDCEKAAVFLPIVPYPGKNGPTGHPTYEWNPRDPFPKYDGTWDTLVVKVRKYNDAVLALEKVQREPGYVKSVCLDSLSELQFKFLVDRYGTDAPRIQDWGEVAKEIGLFCRQLRDLPDLPGSTVEGVVVTSTMREVGEGPEGKLMVRKPFMQGQLKDQSPYLWDLIGYLEQAEQFDEEARGIITTRTLYTREQTPRRFIAGERVLNSIPGTFRLPQVVGSNIEETRAKNKTFQLLQAMVWKARRSGAGPKPSEPTPVPKEPAATAAEQESRAS
jgi:hypothetical protein